MTTFPNLQEFYHRLVPIGENDYRSLMSKYQLHDDMHWIIALEGNNNQHHASIYHWNISIYLADFNGSFLFNKPIFYSPPYNNFHLAYEDAKDFIDSGKCDKLAHAFPLQ